MEKPDIEIEEGDNFGSGGEQFSHAQLVMRALSKCLIAGSKEMCAGYFNTKTDKFGNQIRVYVEDTRHAFIESVKSAMMMMSCDMDEESTINIYGSKGIKGNLKSSFEKLCEQEKNDIEIAPPNLKKLRITNGIYFREGCLNKNLQYYQEFMEVEVDAYRDIVCELVNLSSRKDFFVGEDVGA